MFEKACKLYWNLVCSVGNNGRAYGKGCMLTQRHAITALHVVKGPQRHKACPTIMKHDGLFACEVLLGSEQFDVALLCATKQIRSFEPAQPEGYPSISATKPFLGLSVGYIGSLTIEDDEEKGRTHFFLKHAYRIFSKIKKVVGYDMLFLEALFKRASVAGQYLIKHRN